MKILPKQQVKRGFFAFFTTETGKKLVFYAAGATTVGLFVGNFLPQTFGLKYYKNFVQCYENGVERPVAAAVKRRLEIAMDKLNLQEYERKIVKPFTVFGFDLFQAGSTKYRFGALLGVPVNYSYNSVDDINRNDVRFRAKAIDWQSESGKLLEKSLVLEEDEQIFGLCKSILQLQTHTVLVNSIIPSITFLLMYTLGRSFNMRMNLYARHMSVRLVLYSILGMFGFGQWCFMKDFNQVELDTDVDKRLAELGPEFVDAGLRYYDKLLTKNMALRELLGDNTYTAKGNVNYMIRQKSLPLTIRKSFFEKKLQEMQQQQAQKQAL